MTLWLALSSLCLVSPAAVCADRVIVTPAGTTLGPLSASAEGIVSASGGVTNDTWINGSLNVYEIEGVQLEKPGRQASALSVQVSVLPETFLTPSVSAGLRDVFDTTRQFGNVGYFGRSLYLATGKTLLGTQLNPFPFRNATVTAGLGTGVSGGVFGSVSSDLFPSIRESIEYDGRALNYRISRQFGGIARLEFERLHGRNFIGLELSTPVRS